MPMVSTQLNAVFMYAIQTERGVTWISRLTIPRNLHELTMDFPLITKILIQTSLDKNLITA
jgi:hypothetical protein